MTPTYRYGYIGLAAELSFLSLDEVIAHLKNYLGNFLLDGVVASVYLNRFAADQQIGAHQQAIAALRYVATVYSHHRPMDLDGVRLLQQLDKSPMLQAHAALLQQFTPEAGLVERIEKLHQAGRQETARRILLDGLQAKPGMLWHATQLLYIDELLQHQEPEWLPLFQCPDNCKGLWLSQLTKFYARMGRHADAVALWPEVPAAWRNCMLMNLVAESWIALGEVGNGISLYEASLAMDPLQFPIPYRLNALRHPLQPNPSLLQERTIAIHLYSWNKAEMLEETLQSLASTDIGTATIQVLLNGCTDDSATRVEAVKASHFGDALEIISLPVNVGAPAARNWLVAHPTTKEADYIAFLDDDVELPTDWLTAMLTRLEEHPKAGVVGCKVLTPGTPPKLQYVYRSFAVVRDDIFRWSFDAPNDRHDSHVYDFTRTTTNVMGCCHVFRREALEAAPTFDLRYSPSQMDDIAHDVELRLKGFEVLYCGEVACFHKQLTGKEFKRGGSIVQLGNILGNDIKFFHRYFEEREALKQLRNPLDFQFPL